MDPMNLRDAQEVSADVASLAVELGPIPLWCQGAVEMLVLERVCVSVYRAPDHCVCCSSNGRVCLCVNLSVCKPFEYLSSPSWPFSIPPW